MSVTIYRSTSDTSMVLRSLEARMDVLAAEVASITKDLQMLLEWMRYSNAHRRRDEALDAHKGN